MLTNLALLLLLASFGRHSAENYLITSPYNYEVGQAAHIVVDFLGSKPCEVEVRVRKDRYNDKTIVASRKKVFAAGERDTFELMISPSAIKNGNDFKFEATVCGVKTESKDVNVRQRNRNNVFIQTDKPIYKPGQKIRIRVISIDKDLKPRGRMAERVYVTVLSTRIKQWNNVTLHDGLGSFEVQLSKEPIEGEYTITASVDGVKRTRSIEVKKYVLPKYEVKIEPPTYLALDQKEYVTTICAKYTYGKNVKGKLSAVACLKHENYYYGTDEKMFPKCVNITTEINGCTDITLSREQLNIGSIKNRMKARLVIHAAVTEKLTGITLRNTATKSQFKQRSTQVSFSDTSDKFKPGLPFKYVLKVTHPDGKPAIGARIRVTIARRSNSNKFYNKTFVVTNGMITESIDDATYNSRLLVFKATLLDQNPYPVQGNQYPVEETFYAKPWYSPSFTYLEIINPLNTPAKIDSETSVNVRYTVRRNTGSKVDFHFNVMCNGKIALTGTKTQYHNNGHGKNTTTASSKLDSRPKVEEFDVKIPVTVEMVPSCKVIVYYVRKDKEVVADTIDFDVEDELKNQVSMSFEDKERKPGEKTNLILKASPESRVAFTAVDKSVHLLKAGNELTKDKIRPFLQRPEGRASNSNPTCTQRRRKRSSLPIIWGDKSSYNDASEVFNTAGVIFLSNLNIHTKPCPTPRPTPRPRLNPWDQWRPYRFRGGWSGFGSWRRWGCLRPWRYYAALPGQRTKPPRENEKPKTGKEFSETWLWMEEKLDKSGNKKIEVTVPDTVTTWVATGFAMSPVTGLGISETATIKAFQPFFVSMTLPYSVIRGEEIPVTVTVFNYMTNCVPIKLQLEHKSPAYKVTSYYINKMCVCGDAGQSVKFTIIPTKLGHIPLTVTAATSSAKLCPNSTVAMKDAVTRKLLVEPEGIRKEYTQGTFFCPKNGEYKEVFNLTLPKDIVPGAVYPTVTITGDIMGPAFNNLEDLLSMPYGCGEQNMANLAPSIYIMEYLTQTNQVTGSLKTKAENLMEVGYQRQLTYKSRSGSYSVFGNSDEKGSMMLTAFVVRSLARAKSFIFVDGDEIQHSLQWFIKKQQSNGCFPQYGKLFNTKLQGGVNSELTITAYVTTALLEAGVSTNSPMVSKALSCISNQLDSIKDSYATALVTYTLMLANHAKAAEMMKELRKKAINAGDQMYWTGGNKHNGPARSSADVEMTAYALLAILHERHHNSVVTDEVMDIIRWLSKQRNSNGGFASTQDTCVAFQALAKFAGKAYGNNADFRSSKISGSLKFGNHYNHDFAVTKENKLVLQTVKLPPKMVPGKLEISGKGVGCALIQASVKYYVPDPEEIPVFDIMVDVRKRRSSPDEAVTPCNPLRLVITTRWLKKNVSNMVVVDVKLASGFTAREKSLKKLMDDPLLKLRRYDIEGQNIMLYFDQIKNMTFSIDIHQDTLIKNLKPAVVKAYDYYEPESQAKVMYTIGEAECYGNKSQEECPRCVTLNDPEPLIDALVACNSTVTRMKSMNGMLKVVKAYSDESRVLKQELNYEIPEFCSCEEIYDQERAIVIGQHSYFKDEGGKTTIVLNAGTTLVKWTGPSMRRHAANIRNKFAACKRNGN